MITRELSPQTKALLVCGDSSRVIIADQQSFPDARGFPLLGHARFAFFSKQGRRGWSSPTIAWVVSSLGDADEHFPFNTIELS